MKSKKNKSKGKNSKSAVPDLPTELSSLLVMVSASMDEPISYLEETTNEARKVLYTSHFAAKFTEIGWQFCLILFLTALTGYQSLVLVSTYGLFSGLVVCLSGSSAGAFIDSTKYSRLFIVRLFIWVQNLSVVVATICCFFLLRMVKDTDVSSSQEYPSRFLESNVHLGYVFTNFVPPFNATSLGLLIAIHIFGALANLTDQAITVAMERDWIVVMSKVAASDVEDEEYFKAIEAGGSLASNMSTGMYSVGSISVGGNPDINSGIIRRLKEKTWLSQTNTTMKQIDLMCKVVAPAAAGIFVASFDNNDPMNTLAMDIKHWYDLSYAAIVIGVFNLGSLYVEYTCTSKIYKLVPLLSVRITSDNQKNELAKVEESLMVEPSTAVGCGMLQLPKSLSLYLEQPIASGGLALALL